MLLLHVDKVGSNHWYSCLMAANGSIVGCCCTSSSLNEVFSSSERRFVLLSLTP